MPAPPCRKEKNGERKTALLKEIDAKKDEKKEEVKRKAADALDDKHELLLDGKSELARLAAVNYGLALSYREFEEPCLPRLW